MAGLKEKLLGGVASLVLIDGSGALAAGPGAWWNGFYVGGHAGYSWGSVSGDTTETVLIPGSPPFVSTPTPVAFSGVARDLSPNGAVGGIQAGYNFQVARFVYGVEADLSWTDQRDSFDFSGHRTNLNFEDFRYQETLEAKLRYMGTVRGRIGYAFDAWLPYVTGGFAWGRVTSNLKWTASQAPNANILPFATLAFAGSQSEMLTGWTLGAGFEYAFAPRWSAKVEYLYVQLGEETFFAGTPGGATFGLRDQILRFGINFRL
jgi:outer membrane immunogenic protein